MSRRKKDSNRQVEIERVFFYLIGSLVALSLLIYLLQLLIPLLATLLQLLVNFLQRIIPFLIGGGLVGGVTWFWFRRTKAIQRKNQLLDSTFQQLLEEKQGRFILIDFWRKAPDLSTTEVKQYLHAKEIELSAMSDYTEEGTYIYVFPTNSSPIHSDLETYLSINETNDSSKNETFTSLHSLNQAKLARRLNCSNTTVSRKKNESDFGEWSKQKDPDRIAWRYSAKEKLFYPESR